METKSEKTIIDNNVIREMIETEKTYNMALTLLEKALNIKDNVKENGLLLKLKGSVDRLKNISDMFLTHAIKAIDPSVTEEGHRALRLQRVQLLKAFFEAYKPYAALYHQYIAESSINQEPFKAINLYLQNNSAARLDLASHLIQPLQRGPRYSMLADATKKMHANLTETNILEFAALKALIASSLDSINSELPPSKPGYKFGDFSRRLLGALSAAVENKSDASSSKDKVDEKLDEEFLVVDLDDVKDAPKDVNKKTAEKSEGNAPGF